MGFLVSLEISAHGTDHSCSSTSIRASDKIQIEIFRSDLFDVEVICGVAMGRKQCSGRPGRPKKRIFHGRKPREPEPEKCPHPAPELAADNPIENVFPDLFENSSDSSNSESDHHSTDDSESA